MTFERSITILERGGLIKIDGLREPGHAVAAAAAGADALGFVFAPARRQITAAVARTCIEAAREAAGNRQILTVGVFVDAPETEINAVVEVAGLDLVQLHGSESPMFVERLVAPALKALRPRSGAKSSDILTRIGEFQSVERGPVGFLIDGYSAEASGGSGERADWNLAQEISAVHAIIVAGGLNEQNVGSAIRQVRPLGVDVSSGVESGGIKNAAMIEGFIREAKAAFRSLNPNHELLQRFP